jgi:hypothetical protein
VSELFLGGGHIHPWYFTRRCFSVVALSEWVAYVAGKGCQMQIQLLLHSRCSLPQRQHFICFMHWSLVNSELESERQPNCDGTSSPVLDPRQQTVWLWWRERISRRRSQAKDGEPSRTIWFAGCVARTKSTQASLGLATAPPSRSRQSSHYCPL